MGKVMRDLALPDAAEDLADVVLAAAGRPTRHRGDPGVEGGRP